MTIAKIGFLFIKFVYF